MNSVKVKKSELIDRVTENLAKHIIEYRNACEGYKADAIAEINTVTERLRRQVDSLQMGEVIRLAHVTFSLPSPESHEKDYLRAIEMLRMSVDEEIEVESDDFRRYVMDEWDWKERFDTIRASYSNFQ